MLKDLKIQIIPGQNNPIFCIELTDAVIQKNLESVLAGGERKSYQFMQHARRKTQYAVGRWLARKIMGNSAEIARDENNMPLWPSGWTGSISHRDLIVAVTCYQGAQNCGLDVERSEIGGHLRQKILTTEDNLPFENWEVYKNISEGRALAAVFSAKEAFFKCVYPVVRKTFGFHDVAITGLWADSITLRFCEPGLSKQFASDVTCSFQICDFESDSYLLAHATCEQ